MRDENVNKFLASLIKEIASEQNTDQVRMMGCIICKNLISDRSGDSRFTDLWVKTEPEFKKTMKEAIVAQLACQSSLVRTQVSNLVAAVAAIELPIGQWYELLGILCTNAQHTNQQVKAASLMTLGYICENIEPKDLSDQLRSPIIQALTQTISKDEGNDFPNTTIASKALLRSINFADQNFHNQQERDYIMNKIFEALEVPVTDVRESAMQTLVEIAHLHYNYLEHYLVKIAQATALAANNDDAAVGIQGIEFWTNLTEIEIEKRKRNEQSKEYIKQVFKDLTTLLLQNISKVIVEDDEEDDDDVGVQQSSGVCLHRLSLLVGGEILQPVLEYVRLNIMAQQWQSRYAAIVCLGAICECPDKQSFKNTVVPSLQQLQAMY